MDASHERQWSGFSGSLSHTAMIRAMFVNDVFIPKHRSIHTTIQLRLYDKMADPQALLDCGATENFVHPRLIKQYDLKP